MNKKLLKMAAIVSTIFFSTQNANSQTWDLSGNANATATSLLGTTNSVSLRLATKNTPRLIIDTLGRVGIGITIPSTQLMVRGSGGTPSPLWTNIGRPVFGGFGETNVGNGDFILGMASAAAPNATGRFAGRRSRGTLAAPAAVINGDQLMSFSSFGFDNTGAFQNPANIEFTVDAAPAGTAVPTGIALSTGTNGVTRAERMRIASNGDVAINSNQLFVRRVDGKVGIGTSTPTANLDVVGFVKIADGSQGAGKVLTSDASGMASWTTPSASPWTLSRSNIFNSNIGNVGIGTSTPSVKLDVSSASAFAAKINGGSNMYIGLFENNLYRGYLGSYSGNDADVDFGTGAGNNGGSLNLTIKASPKMTIDSVGRVGVGTTLPNARLDVLNTNGTTGINVVNNYASNTTARGIEVIAKGNMGYGYGIQATGGLLGGYFIGDGDSATGNVYGAFCSATGGGTSSGTRIGVYGTASGGTVENWGGYFPTKVYATEMRIGTTTGATGYKLSVNGKIIGTEVRVEALANWPDYVFSGNHKLLPLEDLEASINANKHLPGIPSAKEIKDGGIMLGDMQTKQMEKIEELTLYLIQISKENKELKARIEKLENK